MTAPGILRIQLHATQGFAQACQVPGVMIAATGAGRVWEHAIAPVVVVGSAGLVSIGCINPSMPGEVAMIFDAAKLGALMDALVAASETMGEGAP